MKQFYRTQRTTPMTIHISFQVASIILPQPQARKRIYYMNTESLWGGEKVGRQWDAHCTHCQQVTRHEDASYYAPDENGIPRYIQAGRCTSCGKITRKEGSLFSDAVTVAQKTWWRLSLFPLRQVAY